MVDKIRAENEEIDKDQKIQFLNAKLAANRQLMIKTLLNLNSGRTHFILELLQNAEDAIGQNRHPESRTVSFELTDEAFSLSHYGKPFDENDVDGICDISSSTKREDEGTIGKFGIGFISVYRFTETPRISSGSTHHFEINESGGRNKRSPLNYKDPQKTIIDSQKTIIKLPFKIYPQGVKASIDECLNKSDATDSINKDLTKLDGQTILFLRHITRIEWQTPDGSGFLERTDTERTRTDTNEDTHVRSVTVNSSFQGKVEHWLIFDRDVTSDDGSKTTSLEIAFHQSKTDEGDWSITRIERNLCLSVYFPARKEKTHLGFHVQGGFEPTTNRESILEDNEWNEQLVKETGELLVKALLWLKQKKKLDKGVLECLPIEQKFFLNGPDCLFAPVAARLVTALREEELLPTASDDYCKAEDAAYTNIVGLDKIFNVAQLETLFNRPIRWLSKIECSPLLLKYNYLKKLDILEITIEDIIDKLNEDFLKDQNDSWFRNLYAFLLDQSRLFDAAIKQKPILRLEDGRHVCPPSDSEKNVFLPPKQGETKYTCVKKEVLKGDNGENARKFLEKLGIKEPDLVEDALERIKDYKCQRKTPCITQYEKDLETILDVHNSEAKDEHEKEQYKDRKKEMYKAIENAFIVLVDRAGRKSFEKPDQVYLPTDDLKTLIGDREGTLFADKTKTIIKEEMYDWMKHCGVHDHLRIKEYRHDKECPDDKAFQDLFEIMKKEYKYVKEFTYKQNKQEEKCREYTIPELEHIFCKIDTVEQEKKADLSKKLWDQMENVNSKYWTATISWFFCGKTYTKKDLRSKIKRQLNDTAWILDPDDGKLKKPSEISFPEDWDKHPDSFENIEFMNPEVVEYLISKGVSEKTARALSKKLSTPEAVREFIAQMMEREAEELEAKEKPAEEEPIETSANSDSGDTPHTSDLSYPRPNRNGEPTQPSEHFTGGAESTRRAELTRSAESTAFGGNKTSSGGSSAVMVINLGDALNTKTEDAAINFVLKEYLDLIDANEDNPNNPGYDLHNKKKNKFIEVKGVRGEFTWVSMTITQFKCAMEKGDQYWLYVVEYAESDEPKLYKLHDLARSLTEANVIIKKDGLDWQ